jgi:hypothetical protein
MGYRFRRDDASVEAGVRRIADEQLGKAVAALGGEALHEGVHDARKRVKKLRGLLRLVRPGFKGYAEENRTLRDAARTLSGLRDHAAMIETLDRLAARYPGRMDGRRMVPLRRAISRRGARRPTAAATCPSGSRRSAPSCGWRGSAPGAGG